MGPAQTFNAKQGAFGFGKMGGAGNGGAAGKISGLNINRDRWKGFDQDQRQDWRAFQRAGGRTGTGGGFGAFRSAQQQTSPATTTYGGAFTTQQAPADTPPQPNPTVTNAQGSDYAGVIGGTTPNDDGSIGTPAADTAGTPAQTAADTTTGSTPTNPGLFGQWIAQQAQARGNPNFGPNDGVSRQAWLAAHPNLANQFRDYRREQRGLPPIGQGGPAWTQTPYSKHFVDMLPNLVERAFMENYSPAGASSFDWNDPRDIKRAAQYAYVDMQPSYYRQNAMGGGRPSGGAFARNSAPQPNGITWPRSKGALPPPTYPSPLIGGGG